MAEVCLAEDTHLKLRSVPIFQYRPFGTNPSGFEETFAWGAIPYPFLILYLSINW